MSKAGKYRDSVARLEERLGRLEKQLSDLENAIEARFARIAVAPGDRDAVGLPILKGEVVS